MKRIAVFSLLLLLISCGTDSEIEKEPSKITDKKETEVIKDIGSAEFVVDTVFLERKFKERPSAKEDLEIVKLIGLCNGEPSDSVEIMNPPCDERLFKIVQLNDNISKDNLCLVEVERGIYGNKDRKIYIVERENNEFVRLNTMIGYLEETRSTKDGYKDLLIVHVDHQDRMTFAMKYAWSDSLKKYQPNLLESYDGIFGIKPELQDSVTQEAVETLKAKKIILD